MLRNSSRPPCRGAACGRATFVARCLRCAGRGILCRPPAAAAIASSFARIAPSAHHDPLKHAAERSAARQAAAHSSDPQARKTAATDLPCSCTGSWSHKVRCRCREGGSSKGRAFGYGSAEAFWPPLSAKPACAMRLMSRGGHCMPRQCGGGGSSLLTRSPAFPCAPCPLAAGGSS